MDQITDFETEDLRLVILRILHASSGYRANESLLTVAVERWGHVVSRDRIRTELAWLREQGLVAIDEIGGVMIASLRERGSDVATGVVVAPGVKRPRPQ